MTTDLGRTKPLSVIITAHSEGPEVLRTVESVRSNTRWEHEIIVVDDGSNDGSCEGLHALGVRVIRHRERVGVACSRDAGTKAAVGDVFAFLDAHQRVAPGCLDRCAELAALYGAITCPPYRPLGRRYAASYGASFRLCSQRGFFSGQYRLVRPREEVTRISGRRSPGYVIPRTAYGRVGWSSSLRGWGATDDAVAVKAFFTEVFRANLTADVLDDLDSPGVRAEHERFMELKVRPDREFWRGLLRIKEPVVLTH